ncbi:succinate dehydrogenase, cytochrome b556 subunit [Lamprobacter modestohalophilus]|uniref:Succinate dehydrogenase cytochrome b556 subunit n=1 Tax=Lamprobacter modestohalophilus TaxID=1064514 RepID=A0A9X0W931_9GAMM|nr:succinate dehydrogenase, cytochrome b556 subunit [Lamprobacter modestohalophilus]MBK1619146.1 succinate dehydrogenase, cytochrome b556 subunit [Lamprobacter modestohalophilus]
MVKSRPVFLELWRIRLPIPGVVSILHRVSGLLMVLAIPVFAAVFAQALSGSAGFASVEALADSALGQLVLLLLGWSLLHHLFAGIRYLALDLGWGLDRPSARKTAWTALYSALALTLIGAVVLR